MAIANLSEGAQRRLSQEVGGAAALHLFEEGGLGLFDEFTRSRRCQVILNRMAELLLQHDEDDLVARATLYKDFAGALYEELAYFTLGVESETSALLPPEETFAYFQHYLYPQATPTEHSFTMGLSGISVPDGLRVHFDQVVSYPKAVYEYTLVRRETHLNQYFSSKYRHHRQRQRLFPDLFTDIPLVFVVPHNKGVVEYIRGKTETSRNKVGIVELPFTHRDFNQYTTGLRQQVLQDVGSLHV